MKGGVEKSREGTQQDGVSVKSGLDLTCSVCGCPEGLRWERLERQTFFLDWLLN